MSGYGSERHHLLPHVDDPSKEDVRERGETHESIGRGGSAAIHRCGSSAMPVLRNFVPSSTIEPVGEAQVVSARSIRQSGEGSALKAFRRERRPAGSPAGSAKVSGRLPNMAVAVATHSPRLQHRHRPVLGRAVGSRRLGASILISPFAMAAQKLTVSAIGSPFSFGVCVGRLEDQGCRPAHRRARSCSSRHRWSAQANHPSPSVRAPLRCRMGDGCLP